ncbi:MAG: YceI family protein [Dehalococcoidia bacterium]|nr:YceI family protein [Dehalococcoidia bacterium]
MRRVVIIAGALAAVGVVVAAAGLFWFFNGAAPEAASVDAVLAKSTAVTAASATAPTTMGSSATATATAAVAATGDLAVTYQIAKGDTTFVGYRIKEVLSNIGSNTVVGRTGDVTGSLMFDGEAITAVDITVQTKTLKSDDDRRDGQLVRGGIQTSQFPTSTFILKQPIAIASVPADGVKVKFDAVGDFTLHGVTKRVTIPLEAARQGANVIVAGSLEVVLADYSISKPTAPSVVSIEDKGSMEFQLVFKK